ncbi:MAG: T9SS type A sorting domain-containing protein [Bacteroidota bacterium]
MKPYILLFLLICLSWGLSAQMDVKIEPDPIEMQGDIQSFDIAAKAVVRNNEGETLRLRWRRIEVDMPPQWSTWVCDKNLCYGPAISETPDNFPMEIEAGGSGTMDIHINPNETVGNGLVKIEISLFDDASVILDTATYAFDALLTSTTELTVPRSVKVFPNPTTNYIMLSDVRGIDEMVVYNLMGREVRSFQAVEGRRYSVADLPNGIYLLSLVGEETGIIKTLRLNKK